MSWCTPSAKVGIFGEILELYKVNTHTVGEGSVEEPFIEGFFTFCC